MDSYLSRARTPTSPSPSPEPVGGPNTTTDGTGSSQQESRGNVSQSLPPSTSAVPSADRFQGTNATSSGGGIDTGTLGTTTTTTSGMVPGVVQGEAEIARQVLEEKIRIGVDDLMQLAVCAGDVQPGDEEIVRMKINETMDSLQAIQDATNLPDLTQMVPEDVMGMIDQGRNPDIHTRTFTNRLNGDNQQMRGQANNFDRYRSRLRAKVEAAFPEMKAELEAMDALS